MFRNTFTLTDVIALVPLWDGRHWFRAGKLVSDGRFSYDAIYRLPRLDEELERDLEAARVKVPRFQKLRTDRE